MAERKHWTQELIAKVEALSAEVESLKAGTAKAEPATGITYVGSAPATTSTGPTDYAAFYERLITSLAASQGMSAFSPDSLAGVKANAAGAWLVFCELRDNHEKAVAEALANAERRRKQEQETQATERANREAREARRGRAAATKGPVNIEHRMPAPRIPGMSAEENALVAAAAAGGLLTAPEPD
jgi:hypothetical protein